MPRSSESVAALASALAKAQAELINPEKSLAATWAGKALVAKNSLTTADAKVVEDAFERRLSELPSAEAPAASNNESSAPLIAGPPVLDTSESAGSGQAKGIDKSILAIVAPRRYRSRVHLRYVMQQPCLLCGRKPSDPHHLRYMQPRALGRKASDEFAVPLCRVHHRATHRAGDERARWKAAGSILSRLRADFGSRRAWRRVKCRPMRSRKLHSSVWL